MLRLLPCRIHPSDECGYQCGNSSHKYKSLRAAQRQRWTPGSFQPSCHLDLSKLTARSWTHTLATRQNWIRTSSQHSWVVSATFIISLSHSLKRPSPSCHYKTITYRQSVKPHRCNLMLALDVTVMFYLSLLKQKIRNKMQNFKKNPPFQATDIFFFF